MGDRYGREYQGTMNAGYIVGELMRFLGYEKDREAALPSSGDEDDRLLEGLP
jgi:hypothetical protein